MLTNLTLKNGCLPSKQWCCNNLTGTKLMCGILGEIVYRIIPELKCLDAAHIIHDVIHVFI